MKVKAKVEKRRVEKRRGKALILKRRKSVVQAKAPEPDALEDFARLFEQHQAELLRYLYSMVAEIETARDLAQETFIRSYEWWLTKNELNSPGVAWRPLLYKIATNCALDWLRRQTKIRFNRWPLTSEDQTGSYQEKDLEANAPLNDPTGNVETRLAILAALGGLDSAAQICLLLYYEQGFSCAEISSITGDSHSAIWQRLSRARRLFCELYQKEQAWDV